jgi:UDP-glucose 4-epimerase
MRVMVTGGCGLVGSLAVRQLLELGHEPVAYDLAPRLELLADVQERVRFVRGDVLNLPELLAAVREHGVRRILHTASFLTPGAYDRPYAAVETNVMGAMNVYEAVRALGLERGVFCSTGKVRNDAPTYARTIDDGDIPIAADPYTTTKITCELLLSDYRQQFDLDLVVARFCGLIYGPGYAFSGAIGQALQDLVEKPLRGEPVRLDEVRHGPRVPGMLYARDAADGGVRATVTDGLRDWVFNVNAHGLHPLAEIGATIRELIPGAQVEVPPAEEPGTLVPPDPLARDQLGYVARYSIADGLGEYVEFLRTARLRDWKVPV